MVPLLCLEEAWTALDVGRLPDWCDRRPVARRQVVQISPAIFLPLWDVLSPGHGEEARAAACRKGHFLHGGESSSPLRSLGAGGRQV